MSDTVPTPNSMPGATPPQPDQGPLPAGTPTPPWGTDNTAYDADTAARLIANLRASENTQAKTIKTANAKIADLETRIAEAEAANEQKRREQGEMETLRQDYAAVQEQLAAAQQSAQSSMQAALLSKVAELACNRDPNRAGSAFINPDTAAKLIDTAGCLTDGQIDAAVIASKLDALAKDQPYLVVPQPSFGHRPNPSQGQGNGFIPPATAQHLAEQAGDIKGAISAVAQHLYNAAKPPSY